MAFESFKFYKSFQSSSPGSLMIMGEHAVLHGQPAIVTAINKYLQVELQVFHTAKNNNIAVDVKDTAQDFFQDSANNSFRDTAHDSVQQQKQSVRIKTWLPDEINHQFDLDHIERHPQLEFVLSVIDYFKSDLSKYHFNYEFIIKSEINHTMGLGSSAAVTITMIKSVLAFMAEVNNQSNLTEAEILKIGREIITKVQGAGSGADLAASLFGGVLCYQMQNSTVEKIADQIPIVAVYCGYKLSTKNVIAKIATANQDVVKKKIYQKIFELIGMLTLDAKTCIINQDWQGLGQLFNMHYGLQEALELSDANIAQLIYNLKAHSNIAGAKISGSGLGDCIIGILADPSSTDINLVNILL